jgi:uncharacterized protein YkwD
MRGGAPCADVLNMGTGSLHHKRLVATVRSLALLAVAAVLAAPGSAAASQPGCPGAGVPTTDAHRFQKAMLCLHNAERRDHGVSRVHWNRTLAGVATRYSRTMVSNHFFDHYSPNHRDHMDRIAASGYRPDSGCWTAGENLFFSAGVSGPRQLLKAWMHSAVHRATILHGGWHDFGLGVAYGSPYGGSGMTVVALFGVRANRNCG